MLVYALNPSTHRTAIALIVKSAGMRKQKKGDETCLEISCHKLSDSPTASWRIRRLQQETRMAAPHCFYVAPMCGVVYTPIEPSGGFDRAICLLIRADEVGVRLDAYV